MVQPAVSTVPVTQAAAWLMLGKSKVVANASNIFFKVTFSFPVVPLNVYYEVFTFLLIFCILIRKFQ